MTALLSRASLQIRFLSKLSVSRHGTGRTFDASDGERSRAEGEASASTVTNITSTFPCHKNVFLSLSLRYPQFPYGAGPFGDCGGKARFPLRHFTAIQPGALGYTVCTYQLWENPGNTSFAKHPSMGMYRNRLPGNSATVVSYMSMGSFSPTHKRFALKRGLASSRRII